ncbi:MAG: GGDEF domain-containing phosphodiesterase [Candidatus Limivivens sp.]|nr:GGDEF domain-containing phosphodiesterase [Candidatus Limivivens sp.]
MINYNMDFLISALVFLTLILYHFMIQRKLNNSNSRIFRLFILLGISDIIFDIITTILIMEKNPACAVVTMPVLTIFYLLQVLIPYALFCYAQTLRSCSRERSGRAMLIGLVPPVILMILVLCNYGSGLLFYLDAEGGYQRGPLYMVTYYYALAYVGVVAVSSIYYYKELGFKKFCVICEFLLIEGVCVAIQAWKGELLMTGFGIGLGITVLYLSINNPYEYTDNLTGAFDQKYFGTWMQEQMRKGLQMNVLAVDAYRLKRINTIFGASTGDHLLAQAALKLQEISSSSHVFRITGNRFLMVTYSLSEYESTRSRVQKLFCEPFEINGEQISFPAIICGIMDVKKLKESDALLDYVEYLTSLAPDTQETLLIQDTDKTMEGFRYEREIERYLNVAIEKDLFEVYYQPVYSMKTGTYVTLEALSRLRHPTLGVVSPEIFISIAEKSGQIAQIGYLQFRRVCRFVKENEPMMRQIKNIKFNLSPMELMKRGYSQLLIDTIREQELPFSYFQFEITETVATEYSANLYQAVADFLEVGIGLCLDDFGSGYANLNTVLKLPFSSIKLDRSLLCGICEDEQIAVFYRSIVSVMQNMGYDLIAEGVETREEMEKLESWGVNMIQGYYFSRPVSSSEILRVVMENKRAE